MLDGVGRDNRLSLFSESETYQQVGAVRHNLKDWTQKPGSFSKNNKIEKQGLDTNWEDEIQRLDKLVGM